MIILSSILNLIGLLLIFIGLYGVYKNRENLFGSFSNSDIDALKHQLSQNPQENVTGKLLKKVTKAHDYFICVLIGFFIMLVAVALNLFSLVYPH